MDEFEKEMLKTIAKFHRHPLDDIEYVYQKIKQFDKVITLINFADEFNQRLRYMGNLFVAITKTPRNAFEWINWAGKNNKFKATVEETLKER